MKVIIFLSTVILVFLCCGCESVKGQLFTTNDVPVWKIKGGPKSGKERLILTPYINDYEVEKARKLARVDENLFLNVLSYSGYLTVNEKYNSNLWFWFFPAEGTEDLYEGDNEDYEEYEDYDDNDYVNKNATIRNDSTNKTDDNTEEKPLVLWLQGGPGSSSLFGLFTENGPFFVNSDQISLTKNNYSWHKNYSMLFIDNPVGTGFSFTDDYKGYATNISRVSKELYLALVQFLKLFPWLESNPFFITGESFAGKYIPGLGYEIYQRNKYEDFQINLQGLALGNALSDPYHMLDYSEFAYQTGLVDIHGRREMKIFELLAKENIDTPDGKVYWDMILYVFLKNSNYTNLYNILEPQILDLEVYLKFVDQPHIRKALHVGNQEFSPPFFVYYNLIPDFLTSVIPWIETLLEAKMRILYYSGNMDFIVAYPLSENSYKYINWSGQKEYQNAKRKSFFVNDKLAGYIKKAKNFAEAVILNAGHMVPTDQPAAAFYLIDRFIKNKL